MFDHIIKNTKKINLDHSLLYYGVKNESQWISELADKQIFVEPMLWGDIRLPIFGKIKNGEDRVCFTSLNNKCSRKMLEKYVDFDCKQRSSLMQLQILVSTCPLKLDIGTPESNEFLRAV